MFIVTNKAEVKKRIGRNRLFFWLGIACLVGSMATLIITTSLSYSVYSTYFIFIFGYPLLFLGIILTKRGSFNNRRLGIGAYKVPPEEVEIDNELKGVPPRYHLYNYLTIGGIPVDHLLVTPQGFIILDVKGQMGKLTAHRDIYRLKRGAFAWLGTLGEPGFGNPSTVLTRNSKLLRKWFEEKGYDIPVDGIVVLNGPRTTIESVEDMSFPVCMMKDLRAALREWQTELNMHADEQLEVERLLIQTLPEDEAAEAERLLTLPPSKRAQEQVQVAAETRKEVKPEKPKKPEKKERKSPVSAPTGQRIGLNGKPLPPKPVAEKPKKRGVAPLQRPNPGAFGDPANRKK